MTELREKVAKAMFVSVFNVNPEDESGWGNNTVRHVYEPLAQLAIDTVITELMSDEVVDVVANDLFNNYVQDCEEDESRQIAVATLSAAIAKLKGE